MSIAVASSERQVIEKTVHQAIPAMKKPLAGLLCVALNPEFGGKQLPPRAYISCALRRDL
jgi:hypothetical protein